MRKYPIPFKSNDYRDNLSKINLNTLIIPEINDRIIILDTVTTGSNPKENNIMEIGCLEMIEGKLTGLEFHAFLHPRYSINEITKQKTNLNSNFYDDFYKDAYISDHKVLEQFKSFVGQSVIVAHNASKTIEFINNDFIYHKINIFPRKKFFCTLSIFRQMFPDLSRNICSLMKCCDYLDIKLPRKNHYSAKYDSFMVAKLMSKLFDIINEVKEIQSNKTNLNFSFNNKNNNKIKNNFFKNKINNFQENYGNNNNKNFIEESKNENLIKLNEDDYKSIFQYNDHFKKLNNINTISNINIGNHYNLNSSNNININKSLNLKNDINFKKINSLNVIHSFNNNNNNNTNISTNLKNIDININQNKTENKNIFNKKEENFLKIKTDNEIKLTKKRKLGFEDLIQNLKNKVNKNNVNLNKNKK